MLLPWIFLGVVITAMLVLGVGYASKSRPILVYCGIGMFLLLIAWSILSSDAPDEAPKIEAR